MHTSIARVEWSKFGRDLVVIVLGVLIALGFDNVASARADRRLERQYMVRLTRDLRADSAMLVSYFRTAQIGEHAASQLLAILRNPSLGTDSIVTHSFSDATRGAYLSPNSPTIQELMSTGNLRVLRDDVLRDAILTYYADLTWFQRSLQTVMQRGKDPLGEVGWDIQAFDLSLTYAVNLGKSSTNPPDLAVVSGVSGDLTSRFRNHREAERATQRALTYNGMLQPILAEWQHALEAVRRYVPE
jgi:hypothetical protein